LCLHNSIAVAVAALYNQIDIVVAADDVAAADAAAHEYIAEIRKGIDVVVDKTYSHSWKIDHQQCQYYH